MIARLIIFLALSFSANAATSLTQFGITWTFDTSYTTGQYANGDYYVLAPSGLTITGISPAPAVTTLSTSTVTISNATPAVVTWTAHGLKQHSLIRFTSNGTLPTGITSGQLYYVRYPNMTANTFEISATAPNAAGYTSASVATSSAGSGTHTATVERHKNGSMINLPSGWESYTQGFDSAMYAQYGNYYSEVLNVSRPGGAVVSGGNPLVAPAGSSLVSAISLGDESTNSSRMQLSDTAVLTVVAAAPAPGSFRPPAFGTNKTHSWNVSSLNYAIFQSLTPTASTPALAAVEAVFAYPWQFAYFQTTGLSQNTSTPRNPSSPNGMYGLEVAHAVADAALSLNLNYSNAQKETLLIRFVQLGVDIYGIMAFGGGEFRDNAGLLNGAKLPLLVAGLALGNSNMLAWADAAQHKAFSEDLQTWYVTAYDVGRVMYNGDGYGYLRETYITADIGIAEAGQHHTRDERFDGRTWGTPYRDIIGSSHVGCALAATLTIGGKAAWNWAPFFDYSDRYYPLRITEANQVTPWHIEMWDAYRGAAATINALNVHLFSVP